MTLSNEYRNSEYQKPNLTWLWLALFVAIVVMAIAYQSHALDRHGTDAEIVRLCMTDPGQPFMIVTNLETGRQAWLRNLPNGRYGIQIVKDGKEITSFIKEKMRDLDQVLNYLFNRGYR